MNSSINSQPTHQGLRQEKREAGGRNACWHRYAEMDPGAWGWRRPDTADLVAEHLARLAQAWDESGG